ncbi:tudor domain-containing protein 6 isoform X4 [Ascaphus truei]|uniref:tudor domain-containing protein 6 isoform X4 n=1 Tax=Ascaphus truei TaxID=8439 RepID=UPI003F5A0D5C
MCSLPVLGTAIKLRVSSVEATTENPLVRLWGSVGDRSQEHKRLRAEIQAEAAGGGARRAPAVGEQCLVELNGRWQRCRVLNRQGASYRAFLLDRGGTVITGPLGLRRAPEKLFQVPPEVLGYVVSNLVPPQEQGSWSPRALELLGSLQGQLVEGLVRDLLLPQRMVLLEVPAVRKQMLDLGLAKPLPESSFRVLLDRCLTPVGCSFKRVEFTAASPPLSAALSGVMEPRRHLGQDYFYPQLQVGVTEPVLVTQVLDPQRIFCQLRGLSQEVQRLSESMHEFYEQQGGSGEPDSLPPLALGQPCASRGSDGCWYRSLLLEFTPDKRLAKVMHVDWGRKDVVLGTSLRYLAAIYFRMPVVTFPCSLYGVSDGGKGWDSTHVCEFRSLLQGRQLSAKMEYYNSYEHVYVITLFGEDGLNLNSLYGVHVHCLNACQLDPRTEDLGSYQEVYTAPKKDEPETEISFIPPFPTVQLNGSSFYDALVEFVLDPSNFWVRTVQNATKYSEMMKDITTLYSQTSKREGIIVKPQQGQLCCTKFKDNQYYRGTVVATYRKLVQVYFIDHGNTEMVDCNNVKELPAQFKEMPGLANQCGLANTFPVGESWSQEAILAFKVAVVDKELVIHVMSKQPDKYIIEVLDQSRREESNLGKILSMAGHATYEEYEITEPLVQLPHILPAEGVEMHHHLKPLSGQIVLDKSHSKRNQKENTAHLIHSNSDTTQCSPFEDQLFEPGTTVNTIVSFVDSPGLFWCQNAAHRSSLKSLMKKIQEYCANTDCPYECGASACLAKHSGDGKWYRAFITAGIPNGVSDLENVDVIYVDYGNKESVSVKDLRSINDEFIYLKTQAFRCSVYNLVSPLGSNPLVWDKTASGFFQQFADNASKDHVEFKCVCYAKASLHNQLFNIVDLVTPFNSICKLLVEKGYARLFLHKSLAPPIQLHSYYYSMHDLKTGDEANIYITHVTSSLEFFCQLSKNSEILERISSAITQMCSKVQHLKWSQSHGPLCLAKFSDQQWYRGFTTSDRPHRKVFFVDFGNTEKVVKEELLPMSGDAYELQFCPMQAIKCSLSDIPDNVPDEIGAWFEKTVLDKTLKAVIVAKKADGQLIVELFDGNLQINATLKSKLGLSDQKKTTNPVTCVISSNLGINDKRKPLAYATKIESKDFTPKFQNRNPQSKDSTFLNCPSNSGLLQRKVGGNKTMDNALPLESKTCVIKAFSHSKPTYGENSNLKSNPSQIKLSDLPKRNIFSGLKIPVYISHINTISDFFVQIAEDAQLANISDMLNNTNSTSEALDEKDVELGDLVRALFVEDELYYRAVIKQKSSVGFHVEYIDYGNTSIIPVGKTHRLSGKLSSITAMSVCCTLSGPKSLMYACDREDLLLKFTERTHEIKLNCEFVQQHDGKWEVILSDQHGSVNDLVTPAFEDPLLKKDTEEMLYANITDETIKDKGITSSKQLEWNLPEIGQSVEAYVSAVDSPEYFWCQLATSEIDSLAIKIQEAGEHSFKDADFSSAIKIGSPSLVIYSEDDNWYRAIVTKVEADITVRFVDYGNEETVTKERVQQLPNQLAMIPVQAFPCCLSGFNFSEGCWTSEGNTFFYQKVTEDILEVTVLDIQEQGICKVPLASVTVKYKGDNINDEMKRFWKVGPSMESIVVDQTTSNHSPALTELMLPAPLVADQDNPVIDNLQIEGVRSSLHLESFNMKKLFPEDDSTCAAIVSNGDQCLVQIVEPVKNGNGKILLDTENGDLRESELRITPDSTQSILRTEDPIDVSDDKSDKDPILSPVADVERVETHTLEDTEFESICISAEEKAVKEAEITETFTDDTKETRPGYSLDEIQQDERPLSYPDPTPGKETDSKNESLQDQNISCIAALTLLAPEEIPIASDPELDVIEMELCTPNNGTMTGTSSFQVFALPDSTLEMDRAELCSPENITDNPAFSEASHEQGCVKASDFAVENVVLQFNQKTPLANEALISEGTAERDVLMDPNTFCVPEEIVEVPRAPESLPMLNMEQTEMCISDNAIKEASSSQSPEEHGAIMDQNIPCDLEVFQSASGLVSELSLDEIKLIICEAVLTAEKTSSLAPCEQESLPMLNMEQTEMCSSDNAIKEASSSQSPEEREIVCGKTSDFAVENVVLQFNQKMVLVNEALSPEETTGRDVIMDPNTFCIPEEILEVPRAPDVQFSDMLSCQTVPLGSVDMHESLTCDLQGESEQDTAGSSVFMKCTILVDYSEDVCRSDAWELEADILENPEKQEIVCGKTSDFAVENVVLQFNQKTPLANEALSSEKTAERVLPDCRPEAAASLLSMCRMEEVLPIETSDCEHKQVSENEPETPEQTVKEEEP